jgi:hypothetical protein
MKTHPRLPEGHGNFSSGFALVVTISLMILLTVVAIGLLGLSSISLRSSTQNLAQTEAEANARLALMLAIGQLQETLGPDSRISARGTTLARHPKLEATIPPNSPQAWWVGVAHSNPEQATGSGAQPVVWLVSGLNPSADAGSQLTQAFSEPVALFDRNSIDTAALTGGRPIEAGKVKVTADGGRVTGAYAYFIDDNGMKAQLAATNPAVRNDLASPLGEGVLPGSYNVGILNGMEALAATPMGQLNRLGSINDLPLIGMDINIVPAKRMAYTTLSRGVLSDVRKGGLKRDLTIAFENEPTFNAVFSPSSGGSYDSRYIVMDGAKFNQASELKQNGYIHWRMFQEYYNLKKHIYTHSGVEVLDPVVFNKLGGLIINPGDNPLGRGQLGPHQIGSNASTPGDHQRLPYGEYPVMDHRANPIAKKSGNYRHSPVFPVLQRLQQNAWLEYIPPTRTDPARVRTRVQLWTSHYNPYNIGIRTIGNYAAGGPRIHHFPQVRFTLQGAQYINNSGQTVPFQNISGLAAKRESHMNQEMVLRPGRSQVLAFRNEAAIGGELDGALYGQEVRNLTLESIFSNPPYRLASTPTGRLSLVVDFYLQDPSFSHGVDMNPPQADGDNEVAQAFWAMIAWNAVNNTLPGKTISKSISNLSELNENSMASHSFQLRSTKEPGNSLRPLIDANIRAQLANPKWDAPLGLPTLAGYSAANNGEALEPFFPMDISENPRGFTYWGAGDNPMDGYNRVILFDVPREDLVSLGQLQHASVGRFSYEPTYIVGNSYANPRIPPGEWRATVRDTFSTAQRGLENFIIPGNFNLYDASYLVNEELWDSYIFTTIPQIADDYNNPRQPQPTPARFQSLLAGDALLPNPRFIPYEPPGSKFDKTTLQMPSSTRGQTGSFYHNAGHLLVDGSFNVNSTSVDAWEAFLSGTHGLPYRTLAANGRVGGFSPVEGVRFPRVKNVTGGPMETQSLDENYWIGFRTLKPEEVRKLAEAIVEEIIKRGPFLTLGQFVNRKLESGEHGQRGALQAALDKTVNKGLNSRFETSATHRALPGDSSQGAGFPGQLLQGDILQALSPYMTVRSDSFTIRAYGESREPGTGRIRARAWCEAVVQRFPDPVPNATANRSALAELINPSSRHGRTFRLVSFRWLNANEV